MIEHGVTHQRTKQVMICAAYGLHRQPGRMTILTIEATVSAVVSIEHPFDTNDDDHCETSLEAYRDVVPILNHIAAWQ